MMVVFQNKIIYMPSVPPFSRSENIEDYASLCSPVVWQEIHIKSKDGAKLACAISQVSSDYRNKDATKHVGEIVIIYFHGNGGSVPPRLPSLSAVAKTLVSSRQQQMKRITIIVMSYRGYWKSSGRASEQGIRLDAEAALRYAHEKYPHSNVVLWGQSLGAAAAVHAARSAPPARLAGLILETPFVSIRAMLTALYPQKWLPYRYLGSFLWNHWDSVEALREVKSASCPNVLLLQAGKDEIVPSSHMGEIAAVAKSQGMNVKGVTVRDALHNNVVTSYQGKMAIADFIKECSNSIRKPNGKNASEDPM